MTHRSLWTLAAAWLFGGSLPAQVVRLTLSDSVSHAGVDNAVVTMVNAKGEITASGLSRNVGALLLRAPSSGRYVLFVRKLGFAPRLSDAFDVVAGETTALELFMYRIPQFLPEVAIRAERESIRHGTFFGMKIETLGAAIVSPTQVDRAVLGAKDWTDLVARNPGAGNSVDYEQRCVLSTRGYPPECLPVIVDGMLVNGSADVVPPEIVDYILIVRGNELGVMYGSIGYQGAVMLFTKRGLQRGPRDR